MKLQENSSENIFKKSNPELSHGLGRKKNLTPKLKESLLSMISKAEIKKKIYTDDIKNSVGKKTCHYIKLKANTGKNICNILTVLTKP